MSLSTAYISISIIILLIIGVIVFFMRKGKKRERLTPLAQYAFVFVIAGIVFGDDRLIGYSLLGIGILLALIDMYKKSRKSK